MKITEKQALDYISGFTLSMRAKIDIIDSMVFNPLDSDSDDQDIDEFFIGQDERIMCSSLEILLSKARVNVLFEGKKHE